MATETQPPDAVLDSTNYTTLNLADIDEDPDAPDGAWGAWDGNGDTSCRVTFGTPTGNPTVGAGLQEFRALIKKSAAGGATTTWSLQLWENGVEIRELASGTTTSTTGEVVAGTWNANELGTPNGSLVECRLQQTGGGVGGGRKGVEVGAVEWNVTYDVGGVTHQLAGISAAISTAAGALAVDHPVAGVSAAISTAAGALAIKHTLAGVSAAISTATGSLTVTGVVALAGVSAAVSTATGALAVKHPIAGLSAGVSTTTGTLALQLALAGLSAGVSISTGALILSLALAGLSQGTATVSGALGVRYGLSGTSVGLSTSTGALSIVGEVTGAARRGLLLM